MTAVRYGIAGWGSAAKFFHAQLIQAAGGEVVAVVERRAETARDILGPHVRICGTVEDLVGLEEVQVVVIATPSGLHYEHAKLALEGGKHVVVDKPFAPTAELADELCVLAKSVSTALLPRLRGTGRALASDEAAAGLLSPARPPPHRVPEPAVGRRFPHVRGGPLPHARIQSPSAPVTGAGARRVRRLVEDGSIGRVMEFESRFDRFRPGLKGSWKEEAGPGNGVLNDLGAHLADQAVQLFGRPAAVQAQVLEQREGVRSDDFFALTLSFEDRPALRVHLRAGHFVRGGSPRFVVHGTAGTFIKSGLDPQEARLRVRAAARRGLGRRLTRPRPPPQAGQRPDTLEDFGVDREDAWGTLWRGDEVGDGAGVRVPTERGRYDAFYASVARSVTEGVPPPVDPASSAFVMRILDAARRSSATGTTVTL